MKALGFLPILLCSSAAFCQISAEEQAKVDSLQSVYYSNVSDTTKINALITWDQIIYRYDAELDLELCFLIDSISSKIIDESDNNEELRMAWKTKGYGLNGIGIYLQEKGFADSSLLYYEPALEARKKVNDISGVASTYNNMANAYLAMHNYLKAQYCYDKALEIHEGMRNAPKIAITKMNKGNLFFYQDDFDNALKYYTESLKALEGSDNTYMTSHLISNKAGIFLEMDSVEQAINDYMLAREMKLEINDTYGLAGICDNLGLCFMRLEMYDTAYTWLKMAESYKLDMNDRPSLAVTYNNLAQYHIAKKEYKKAIDYASQALELAIEAQYAADEAMAYGFLHKAYKFNGNSSEALEAYEKHIYLNDSLENEDSRKSILRNEYAHEFNMQHVQDSMAFAQKEKVEQVEHEKELQKEANQRYLLYGGLGFALFFGLFIFNRFRVTQKQKGIIEKQKEEVDHAYEELDEKNQEIMDSINYAKRLQYAILPPDKLVKSHLPDSFILYKPKDMVAGDFYWFAEREGESLIAAADCTGHGVPGALVSVVCHNALNRSFREYQLSGPGAILDKTREIVIEEFEKSEEEVKDGMDIALISINGETIKYAGANNPLWVVRGEELIEVKADKQPIGKYAEQKPFTTHLFEGQKGDMIYLFTDGFADQFGGEKGKKYKYKPFKRFLTEIRDLDVETQKDKIDAEFEKWKGELEQIDDVCIIGLRIG